MMKNKLMAFAVAGILAAAARESQASIVTSGTALWYSPTATSLAVNYAVDLTGGVYTYVYTFTDTTSTVLNTFEVDAQFGVLAGVASGTVLPSALGTTTASGIVVPGNEVYWNLPPLTSGQSATVAYTSLYGPTMGSGSAIDGSAGPWSSQQSPGQPVPVPVPEASTILAGALMVLPLGVGAFRALRRERQVKQ